MKKNSKINQSSSPGPTAISKAMWAIAGTLMISIRPDPPGHGKYMVPTESAEVHV